MNCKEITYEIRKKPTEMGKRLNLKPIAKMINLKLKNEIQNIYLFIYLFFIYLFIDSYLSFLSMRSELKENQSWAAKISLSIPNN